MAAPSKRASTPGTAKKAAAARKSPTKPAAKKAVALRKRGNVQVFVGSDDGRVAEAALKRVNALGGDISSEFGLETISGVAESVQHAADLCDLTREALLTLPFFGGGKIVWLKGVNFLADNPTGRSELVQAAWERLVALLVELPDEVQFVLSGEKPDRRRATWKMLEQIGEPQHFDLVDTLRDGWQVEVGRRAAARARELGFRFDEEALELFVHLAGEDSRTVDNEVEKLALALEPGQPADSATVRSLVASSRAGVVFELGDAIGRRSLGDALAGLRHFTARGENAVGLLLAAIVPKVRALLAASELLSRHRLPERSYPAFQAALDALPGAETAHLPRAKTGKISAYPLFLSLREAHRFQPAELRAGLVACLEANRRLVATSAEPELVLVELLTRLCRRGGER